MYHAAATTRSLTGKSAFDYSDTMHTRPVQEQVVHDTLNPLDVDFREARDSDDHPLAIPVAVLFDVTGSMQSVPRLMQETLPELLEALQLKGLVEHPAILFGAIGDAFSDRAPLQIGQFESDNRIEDHLGNIWLEGNGGGSNQESYELAMYFMARHVVTDHFEKRGEKGFLFFTGDEHAYPNVTAKHISRIIGDDVDENISTESVVAELQEKWNFYFVIPSGTSHANDPRLREFWQGLLGAEYVLDLADPKKLADLVAETVGARTDADAAS